MQDQASGSFQNETKIRSASSITPTMVPENLNLIQLGKIDTTLIKDKIRFE